MPIPDAEFLNKIREAVLIVLGDYRNQLPPPPGTGTGQTRCYVAKAPGGGIPAMTESGGTYTPGSATATLYKFDSGDLAAHEDEGSSDVTKTVYNITETAIPANEFVLCAQDIITGHLIAVSVDEANKQPLVRFTLNAALTTSDSSKAATITNQYGPGIANSTSITVYNCETASAGTYIFSADSGDAGLAIWDSGTDYRIIQLECDNP